MEPEVDFAWMARCQGVTAYGPLTTAAELETVLAEAIELVKAGEPVLIDVHTRPY